MLVVVIACGAFALVLFCCFYVFSLLRWRKRLKQGVSGEKKKSPARASSGTSGARSSSTESGGPKLVMFNTKITLAEHAMCNVTIINLNIYGHYQVSTNWFSIFEGSTNASFGHRYYDYNP